MKPETYWLIADILFYKLVVPGILVVVVWIGGAILLWARERTNYRKKFESAFEGRPVLTEEDFYERYFRHKGIPLETVSKIRGILEYALNADLSRLDSKDDFSTNLGFFFQYDSLVDVELVMRLEEEFQISISDEEAAGVSTIESIVELVHKKTRVVEGKESGN